MAFQEEELMIITESEFHALRVVDWNGKKNLVKQGRWTTDTGEIRNGKVKALSKEDLIEILKSKNFHHVKKLMGIDDSEIQ